ncbi:MAG: hypothetical protein Q7S40_06280 [Opitutaceae bacterium]|nr:hypothetical protein [Opitutaceae bacterium]
MITPHSGFSCLAILLLAASPGHAQVVPPPRAADSAPPATEAPAVELSPFVVSEDSDVGWVATETLAGSRLRTNFKDVPNQIETLTKDFMSDLALTNVDQALIYTANSENSTDYMPATPGNQVSGPAGGGRIRGIGSGTISRNFFQVQNPTDNFNIERTTIASGPNAILFGLGSPAGIFDATPARALLNRNRYGFELQYDSEDSKRGTFDANVVVKPQMLALRFMGMSKREYNFKRPNLDRDERVYGTLTFTPFKKTSIILQGERSQRNWNRSGRIVPTDFVTPWLYADRIPGSGYTTAKPAFNNNNLTGIGNNAIFAQAANTPLAIQDGVVSIRNWRNSVVVRNPASLPGVDPTFDAELDITLLDPAIFPFDVNLVGESRTTLYGAYTKTAIIEQKLADNLFLELAYNREDSYNHRVNAGGQAGSSNFHLNVDPNQFIPGTTTPNPYFGQYYFQGTAGNDLTFDDRDDWRAMLSYEFDAGRKLANRGRWGKWLGRHRLSGLFTGSESEELAQQNFNRKILDDPVIPGLTLASKTTRNWATNSTRVPQFRHYFSNPYDHTRAQGSMTGDWTMTDANGQPFTLYLYDTPYVAADGKRLAAGQVPSGIRNKVTTGILAWQGFFLPDRERRDRLVLTYGYRKDSARSANLDAASQTQDFSGLYPVLWDTDFGSYGATQSGINRNIGVVVRPLSWLTLFHNRSTTFDLNIGRYDPFGGEIPGAGGDGRDYGIRLDLWTDKLTLRLNRYENTLGPRRASNDVNTLRDIFYNIDTRVRELDPAAPTINITDGNRRGFRVAGRPNYFIMVDSESKGYELEFNLRPTRNWNVRINGAKSEAIEANIGKPWFDWAEARKPVWEALVASNGELDANGRPVTWRTAPRSATNPTGETLEQYYSNALVGRALAYMAAVDGKATDTARTARANLITNYSFTHERLRGLNIGGAVRWRSAPTIGYGTTINSAGTTVLDLGRAYKGETELYFDAIVGYRGRMKAFGGFNYRLQLNVRNLLDEDDPIPVAAFVTGGIAKLATVDPRLIVVTFAVNF